MALGTGIVIASAFDMNSPLPVDARFTAADVTARNAIPSGNRFQGLLVYTLSEKKMWQLQGGITNSDWKEAGGGGSAVVFGSLGSPRAIDPTLGITSAANHMATDAAFQIIFAEGLNTGENDINNATTHIQIEAGTVVGQRMWIRGVNSDKYIKFEEGEGILMDGTVLLVQGTLLKLWWNGSVWERE